MAYKVKFKKAKKKKESYKIRNLNQALKFLDKKNYTIYEGELMGKSYFTLIKADFEKKELSAREVISFANDIKS